MKNLCVHKNLLFFFIKKIFLVYSGNRPLLTIYYCVYKGVYYTTLRSADKKIESFFGETTSDEVPSARAISISVFSMIPVLLLGTKQSSKL